jgi:hypothetical protein
MGDGGGTASLVGRKSRRALDRVFGINISAPDLSRSVGVFLPNLCVVSTAAFGCRTCPGIIRSRAEPRPTRRLKSGADERY